MTFFFSKRINQKWAFESKMKKYILVMDRNLIIITKKVKEQFLHF